jgi:hypothetical protein
VDPKPDETPRTEPARSPDEQVVAWEAEVEAMTEEEFWDWMADGPDPMAGLV